MLPSTTTRLVFPFLQHKHVGFYVLSKWMREASGSWKSRPRVLSVMRFLLLLYSVASRYHTHDKEEKGVFRDCVEPIPPPLRTLLRNNAPNRDSCKSCGRDLFQKRGKLLLLLLLWAPFWPPSRLNVNCQRRRKGDPRRGGSGNLNVSK